MKDIYHDNVDISEKWLLDNFPKAFETLLKDHSSGENIYWATDMYSSRGEGFGFFDSITIAKIKNDEVIRPRVCKSEEERTRRVKEKAEVFTPAWICNAQNNLIDEAWFGRPNVFNRSIEGKQQWEITERPILFEEHQDPSSRSFENYVKDRRLEITCGEAPYLVSRYDAVSGEVIPIKKRIGMLDRKLQVITQEIKEPGKWLDYAREAVKSIYGFEWQGDSLLLAREAILLSVIEYFIDAFPNEPGDVITRTSFKQRVNNLAHFISCNIWQMDGLNYVLPGTSDKPFCQQMIDLFVMSIDEEIEESRKEAKNILNNLRNGVKQTSQNGIPAVVYDWWDEKGKGKKEKQFFASLIQKQ